jgi:nicotinate-nucleotide pyrophosphorylase (carboxylating)
VSTLRSIPENIDELISLALKEDIGVGDITSLACIDSLHKGKGVFIAKQSGVLCGIHIAKRVFQMIDERVKFTLSKEDGANVKKGTVIAEARGNMHTLLAGERLALNFLQRMSGIATLTSEYVKQTKGTRAVILDTRKTAPLLRELDKYAVRTGGGENLRMRLDDMVLIKDNHIAAAGGVKQALERCENYIREWKRSKVKIEIETTSIAQVKEVLAIGGVDRIMLDNYPLAEIRKAVKLVARRVPLEVSGGVNLKTVRAIAKTGVEYISVGELTHSPRALDISFEVS